MSPADRPNRSEPSAALSFAARRALVARRTCLVVVVFVLAAHAVWGFIVSSRISPAPFSWWWPSAGAATVMLVVGQWRYVALRKVRDLGGDRSFAYGPADRATEGMVIAAMLAELCVGGIAHQMLVGHTPTLDVTAQIILCDDDQTCQMEWQAGGRNYEGMVDLADVEMRHDSPLTSTVTMRVSADNPAVVVGQSHLASTVRYYYLVSCLLFLPISILLWRRHANATTEKLRALLSSTEVSS